MNQGLKKERSHRQVNLACQGLITRNNNAFELARHFIPKGDLLLWRLERYDRFRGEASLLEGSQKGGSYQEVGKFLIYVIPFLKAFGATEQRVAEYSTVSLSLMPGAEKFLQMLQAAYIPCFIVSSAFRPFIRSLCRLLGFEESLTYSTPLDIDEVAIDISEQEVLKDIADEILNMPFLSWRNDSAAPQCRQVFPKEHISYWQRLESILNDEIANMQIGKLLSRGLALAGKGKVAAIKDSLEKTGNPAEGVIYFGSSILDAAALSWVRAAGGLAVSFNGDRAALQSAEVAVMSGNSAILAILSDIFYHQGKEAVLDLINTWDLQHIQIQTEKLKIHPSLISELFSHEPESFPLLDLITDENLERLVEASQSCRRMTLGEVWE